VISNVGKTDRIIRIILGISLIILGFLIRNNNNVIAFVLIIFGIISFVTGVVGWCGFYSIFDFSSKGYGVDKITKREIQSAVRDFKVSDKRLKVGVKKKITNNNKKISSKKKVVKKKSKTKKTIKKKTISKSKKK